MTNGIRTCRYTALIVLLGAALVSPRPALAQFIQQGPKLVRAGGSLQGFSVSVSADGNTAIVGGPDDNGSVGAAWVWTRSGGVWSQPGPKLVASDTGTWFWLTSSTGYSCVAQRQKQWGE